MLNEKKVVRYSEAFKLQIVKEMEESGCNIYGLRQKYGIAGTSTIQKWLQKYGKNHLLNKIVRIEMADEKNELDKLKLQIKNLKETLVQTQMENVKNKIFFEIACEELGQKPEEFVKKKQMKRPTEPPKTTL